MSPDEVAALLDALADRIEQRMTEAKLPVQGAEAAVIIAAVLREAAHDIATA